MSARPQPGFIERLLRRSLVVVVALAALRRRSQRRVGRWSTRRRGPDERRPLRLPRPGGVPVPLAERLLHEAGSPQRDRPPREPRGRVHAAQQGRPPVRRHGVQPRRRLQPRPGDHHQGARPRQSGRLPAHRRGADHRHGPLIRPPRPGGRHRREDEAPPPHLGRDRLQRHHPGGRVAPDPSRRELQGGPPLHRGAAQPEGRLGQDDPRGAGLPALPRPEATPTSRRSSAAAGTWSRCSGPCGRAGHRSPRPLPRLGLHGLLGAQSHPARAQHPQRRLRPAGRPRSP